MRCYINSLIGLWLIFSFGFAVAETPGLGLITLHAGLKSEKLVLELKGDVHPRVLHQKNPERLVLNLQGISSARSIKQPRHTDAWIGHLRFESAADGRAQNLVLDLLQPVEPRATLRKEGDKTRLIVELTAPSMHRNMVNKPQTSKETVADLSIKPKPLSIDSPPKTLSHTVAIAAKNQKTAPTKPHVIAIDAGHGGKDTGAIGPHGTLEKQVVLSIARKLKTLIDNEPGYRAYLVRKGDYFIPLRDRVELAREAQADLFISLHADAYLSDNVKGSSVFTLSQNGATSEAARLLASRENAADAMGGKHAHITDDHVLASVLLDLSQGATLEASDRVANKVLRELSKHHEVRHAQVQKAGFAVLKSPDMPSLLVETAFISNPDEERNLCDAPHQEAIAQSIFTGIRNYFRQAAPAVGGMKKHMSAEPSARHLALVHGLND